MRNLLFFSKIFFLATLQTVGNLGLSCCPNQATIEAAYKRSLREGTYWHGKWQSADGVLCAPEGLSFKTLMDVRNCTGCPSGSGASYQAAPTGNMGGTGAWQDWYVLFLSPTGRENASTAVGQVPPFDPHQGRALNLFQILWSAADPSALLAAAPSATAGAAAFFQIRVTPDQVWVESFHHRSWDATTGTWTYAAGGLSSQSLENWDATSFFNRLNLGQLQFNLAGDPSRPGEEYALVALKPSTYCAGSGGGLYIVLKRNP